MSTWNKKSKPVVYFRGNIRPALLDNILVITTSTENLLMILLSDPCFVPISISFLHLPLSSGGICSEIRVANKVRLDCDFHVDPQIKKGQ